MPRQRGTWPVGHDVRWVLQEGGKGPFSEGARECLEGPSLTV